MRMVYYSVIFFSFSYRLFCIHTIDDLHEYITSQIIVFVKILRLKFFLAPRRLRMTRRKEERGRRLVAWRDSGENRKINIYFLLGALCLSAALFYRRNPVV